MRMIVFASSLAAGDLKMNKQKNIKEIGVWF